MLSFSDELPHMAVVVAVVVVKGQLHDQFELTSRLRD